MQINVVQKYEKNILYFKNTKTIKKNFSGIFELKTKNMIANF